MTQLIPKQELTLRLHNYLEMFFSCHELVIQTGGSTSETPFPTC